MAYACATYDLPPASRMDDYAELALRILNQFRLAEGIVHAIGMRSVDCTSPQVAVILEYETLDQAKALLDRGLVAEQLRRLRVAGCANIQFRIFDASPLMARW